MTGHRKPALPVSSFIQDASLLQQCSLHLAERVPSFCCTCQIRLLKPLPPSQARAVAGHHGISTVSPNVHAYLSRALEAHMGDLLRRAYVIARQRSDVGRRMPGMEVSRCTFTCFTALRATCAYTK